MDDDGDTSLTALVIDDHPLYRDALTQILQEMVKFGHVHATDTVTSALFLLESRVRVDVIVVDLELPDAHGVDALVAMHAAAPEAAILAVGADMTSGLARDALAAGAVGFITKLSCRAEIRAEIERLCVGHAFPSASVLDETEAAGRLASLTPQQARILDLICQGKLNKQIAFDLSIAETTVKTHVTAILRKLDVHSRTQAVLLAQTARADGPTGH
ncbi:response regulator transcription factor [Marivita sp. S2033]|uniref:response regulator transcription factor n=1 Tax=Marivita sp. S2033 TaxID=3373187 RepID=UPI0039824800